MINETRFSIRAYAHKKLVAIRKKLNLKPKYSVVEVANQLGFTIVYPEFKPAGFTAFPLWNDSPAIAVNSDLAAHEQALAIAAQLAYITQRLQCNSMVLDQPWKWEMLDAAPNDLRERICELDEKSRAHLIMLNHASGDEFRAYIKDDYRRLYRGSFYSNRVAFQLKKLQIKIVFVKFCRKLFFVGQHAS
jgi:hypothetical protein